MAHDPTCPCCQVKPEHICKDCNGTGRDEAKTKIARRGGWIDEHAYIACHPCNGNGLDPAAFFAWSTS